jgi:glycerol-3-phosphate cytidylyltransferase-like family protein
LIVALESDEFIHTSKKRAPIHNQKERQMILENLRSVDMVISLPFLQSYDEYLELVKIIRPQIIAVTENDSQLFNKERQAEMVGGRVIAVTPQIKTFSTTKILTGHR